MSDKQSGGKTGMRRRAQRGWTGETIRALREHMNLTQREMADELEVRQQTISEWETNLHTPHRTTQRLLSMIAERVEFQYQVSSEAEQAEPDA